ncbi:glycosyltransferase [Candidatus Pacearchaeota archaeon]|nr:glycosyltransferase [Candidatus Pacearchaeota archaeon]
MINLSLVIPAHNGERVIKKSIEEYYSTFSEITKNLEIIVVCNGCRDDTFLVCTRLKDKFPIRVIEIPQRGKGYALIKGFNEAKYDVIGFLDADNPFELNKVVEMIKLLENNDVVVASKYLMKQMRFQDSLLRRIISLCGGIISRMLFNLRISDTQAGAKFFKRGVWDKIKSRDFVCNGFDFDIEFLYLSQKTSFKIAEFYIPLHRYEGFSTFRLKYLPGMLKRLLKLRFLR